MEQLTVALPGREYDILIERGLLQNAGTYCASVLPQGCRIALVTDSNVGPRYSATVAQALERSGFQVKIISIPAGETSKNAAMLEHLWEAFLSFGLTRGDAVAALGGGMVGDLAGFAAATILRGVLLIQMPTTLLAQVDSSVGGKVAIDLKAGKNLAGAFWQPKLVLLDPDVLKSLPDETFADGMAEVIKYGCIADAAFFGLLEQCEGQVQLMEQMEAVLYTCCAIKSAVVQKDELDTGLRMILNFGHTLGHAYEKAYHYETYTHGQAVAAGMCRASEIGAALAVTPTEIPAKISHLVQKFGLPDRIPCSIDAYQEAIGLDKKGVGSQIRVILLNALGQAVAIPMEKTELLTQIRNVEKEYG